MTINKEYQLTTEQELEVMRICFDLITWKSSFLDISEKYFEISRMKDVGIKNETMLNRLYSLVSSVVSKNIKPQHRMADYKQINNNVRRAIRMAKKRWAAHALKYVDDDTKFIGRDIYNKKIDLIQRMKDVSQDNKGDYIKSNLEEFKSEKIKRFEDWISNGDDNLSNFIYLHEMSDEQIDSAFEKDILLILVKCIIKDCNGDLGLATVRDVKGIPTGLHIDIVKGMNSNNVMSMIENKSSDGCSAQSIMLPVCEDSKSDNETGNGDGRFCFYTCNFDAKNYINTVSTVSDKAFQYLNNCAKELSSGDVNLEKRYVLDNKDTDIQRFIVSKALSNNDFSAEFCLNELLDYTGTKRAGNTYELFRLKLAKLAHYIYNDIVVKNGKIVSHSMILLVSKVVIKTDDGVEIVTVQLNKDVLNEVSQIPKNELDKLKYKHSKNLAFYLDSLRSRKIDAGINLEETSINCHINSIEFKVYLGKYKTLKDKMNYLEKAFSDLKKNNLIVKNYKINESKTSFDVSFFNDLEARREMLKRKFGVEKIPVYTDVKQLNKLENSPC